MTKRGKKWLWLMIVTTLTVITACGGKEATPEAVDVPNNQAGKTNEKETPNEANDIDSEIENADLSGNINELTANGMTISKATILEGDGEEEGETVAYTNKGEDQAVVEFTEKTEFKKLIIKNMKDGRLEKGSKSDLVVDDTIYLYGSEAGSKFMATKVVIVKLE
ncbi:hypothetical protein [uncultured Vagococcus sp.]|uniref:hypothetical protein n=1 Tax=uncultured Vagococcus sp. TaxID=189676 RepID=UPI0028D5AF2B|nr:hypothetical protein [uncultured Vagococcus sp.]